MLIAREITKRYGSLEALDKVGVTFAPGEVHAVLGENGAGKSTLMGVLAGFTRPDAGTVTLGDRALPLGNAQGCKELGIEMIHQHFTLVPEFTVEENLTLAALDGYGPIYVRRIAKKALQIAEELQWILEPDAKVSTLPVGSQQRIEILKALAAEPEVIILDEPTAVLTAEEVAELFAVLRRLRAEGKTVILIAHKISEVLRIADRITVLRLGKVVGSVDAADATVESLAGLMVGDLPPLASHPESNSDEVLVRAKGVTVRGDRGEDAVRDLSFELRRGRILGFGGVDGNGQLELAEALAGVRPVLSGRIDGPVGAYIPQDRQTDGLALNMSVEDNMAVVAPEHPGLTIRGLLRSRRIREWASELISKFDIKVGGPKDRVRSLSGGNQQKIVVSRVLSLRPDVLVVVNPTRGLDLKATSFVHEMLRQERARGAAIALFTTDLDELFALSDEIFFMNRGELLRPANAAAYVGGGDVDGE